MDGRPLNLMIPSYWTTDDPVSRSRLSWHNEPGHGPYFAIRNVLGSGTMFAQCHVPAVPYPELADSVLDADDWSPESSTMTGF